jgi:hypothetical protein
VVSDVGIVWIRTHHDADLGHWIAIEISIVDDRAFIHAIVRIVEAPSIVLQDCLRTIWTACHTLLVLL